MKVDLERRFDEGFHNYEVGSRPYPVRRSAPFFKSARARTRVHRVRRAGTRTYRTRDRIGHITVTFWCGAFSWTTKGDFLHEPAGLDVCPVCEDRFNRLAGLGASS